MQNLVKTNMWRVITPCNNCPFSDNGKAMMLNNGRVDDIKKDLRRGGNFVCHKTKYDLDINMNPTTKQSVKMCAGAYNYLKSIGKPNTIMQIAKRTGHDD